MLLARPNLAGYVMWNAFARRIRPKFWWNGQFHYPVRLYAAVVSVPHTVLVMLGGMLHVHILYLLCNSIHLDFFLELSLVCLLVTIPCIL
jgi:hypothetical protein